MAGEADGYGDFGGGGSVIWEVKAGEIPAPIMPIKKNPQPDDHAWVVKGTDKYLSDGKDPGYFEIEVDQPDEGTIEIKTVGSKLFVYLKVNPTPRRNGRGQQPQISVRWGEKVGTPAGTKPLALALAPGRGTPSVSGTGG